MRTRLVVLLVLVFMLISAPNAIAQCQKCRFYSNGSVDCVITLVHGWAICEVLNVNWCHLEIPCTCLASTETEPLAMEFTVAAVERIDEPTPAVAVVASVEVAQANR